LAFYGSKILIWKVMIFEGLFDSGEVTAKIEVDQQNITGSSAESVVKIRFRQLAKFMI
jgi:hypothetical protein